MASATRSGALRPAPHRVTNLQTEVVHRRTEAKDVGGVILVDIRTKVLHCNLHDYKGNNKMNGRLPEGPMGK